MMYVAKFDTAWHTILYSHIIDYLDCVVRHRYGLAFGRSYRSPCWHLEYLMTSTAIVWSDVQCIECSWNLCLVASSYVISLPILHSRVLNFLPNNICLQDTTGCTPDILLNELISTTTRFNISIVNLFGYLSNGVSLWIALSLSMTNRIAFSAL